MAEPGASPVPFDAIVIVTPDALQPLGGMRLVERAAFCMARAGARRLCCLGSRPDPALRLPDLPTTWATDGDALAAWLRNAPPRVVALDATTVTTAGTVGALATAPGPDALRAAPPATLWRSAPAMALAALLDGPGRAQPPATAGAWHPPKGAMACATAGIETRRAEDALFATLGRPGDGWFTRVVDRRFSRALTRRLLPLGVSPNAVTLVSIAIGIAGGLCFAHGTPAAATIGALLFLASTIIDGCDGELARLTFRESRLGARLDLVGDNVVHVFLFGGIALGLYRRSHDPAVAMLGIVLVVGVALSMAAVYASIVRRPPTPRQQALYEAFASREFAYLLVALTVVGRLDWFLWIAALGTYVFAAGLVLLGRRPASP